MKKNREITVFKMQIEKNKALVPIYFQRGLKCCKIY